MIVAHGGFDSSYEEFFPQMMYLRQLGYTVYLFEGPGQGACLRLHGAPLIIQWEKPVMAVTEYFQLTDVTLIGESLGGFYAPRASAFDKRVTRCVSVAQFPSLKQNFSDHALARFLWQVDLRPLADKLTKDYLIIGGSKDTMSSRASIGRQMHLLKNAKSITAREITEKELGADHCSCGNQQVVMDMIDLWIEGLKRRDKSLQRAL